MDIFPENNSSHFHVQLPEMFHFRKSLYKCALIELKIPELSDNSESLVILTNFIVENYIGGRKLPVLHRCFTSRRGDLCLENQHVSIYVDVKDLDTEIIEISILNGNTLQFVKFTPGVLYCGFHIVEV
jgi:hypothetical protein